MSATTPIRVLIVDDDFHVAHAHALGVSRIPGFEVVGEAHSAASAASMVAELVPDLLLLDMYLPDRSGLDLAREIGAAPPGSPRPDFLLVTASRDLDTVLESVRLGAIYYLVKPFTFAVLREQLLAYQSWVVAAESATVTDQYVVETLLSTRTPGSRLSTKATRGLSATIGRVLQIVQADPDPVTASQVAQLLGVSRPTAQRHLATLVKRDLVDVSLAYGGAGRPEHLYSARRRADRARAPD